MLEDLFAKISAHIDTHGKISYYDCLMQYSLCSVCVLSTDNSRISQNFSKKSSI